MSMSADELNMSGLTISTNDKSNEVGDESTVNSMSADELNMSGLTISTNDESSEAGDESAVNSMSVEMLSSVQETKINFVQVAEDLGADGVDRCFADTAAKILGFWQILAGDENPTSYAVDFGTGSSINLLMILALLPERYQGLICIEDAQRSPSRNGENLSWVHEQTTDLLVRLSTKLEPSSTVFGQGLASLVRNDVDEGWRAFTGRSWLEDQIHLWSTNDLVPDLYRFPRGTKKIVFFFNPTEVHWTVVEVYLSKYFWTYVLYDSLSQGEKGPTWRACQEQFPLLERLICRASRFAEPVKRVIVCGDSVQQENTYDCGPIALYNAIRLLDGRWPSTEIDPETLRLRYLQLILTALSLSYQRVEPSALRAHMRKVCRDYPYIIEPLLFNYPKT